MTAISIARTIVITGASSGLGAELARRYAGQGARLALLGRDADRLSGVAAECEKAGSQVVVGALDVRDVGRMSEWLTAVDRDHPVDTVICSAGISGSVAPGDDLEDPALAIRQVEVNLLGAMNVIAALAPGMIRRRRGRIALIASVAGLRGLPYSPAYSASKAGVRAYGEALRPLLKPAGVSVTVVTPGFFDSPMTDRWQGDAPFLWSVERVACAVQSAVAARRPRLSFPWPLTLALRLADLAPPGLVDPILRRFHFHILPPA